jgi:hypothetical protein
MSNIILAGSATGAGTMTVQAPETSSNRVLTLADTNGTLTPVVSGTAQTASGTSVDFTGIPSWVKRITVMFSGVSTNGTSAVQIQVGSGSVTTSGYFSNYGAINGGTGQGNITSGIYVTGGMTAASITTGNIVLNLISGNTWVGSGVMLYTNGAGAMYMMAGSSPNLAGSLDRIRITTVNGTDTFDAGTINIMYE